MRAATATVVDWKKTAEELDAKSPLEVMDHALKTFGSDIGIAFSGAEDVALIEYAHLTGRPYRVFRCGRRGARPAGPGARAAMMWRAPAAAHARCPEPAARRGGAAACTRPPCCKFPPNPPNPPRSLDTGRLNAETYQLFDAVEKHYNIHIEYTFPDAQVGV